eukprot:1431434-Karenia_brevis.AAC.1
MKGQDQRPQEATPMRMMSSRTPTTSTASADAQWGKYGAVHRKRSSSTTRDAGPYQNPAEVVRQLQDQLDK